MTRGVHFSGPRHRLPRMTREPDDAPPETNADTRWAFLRDVAVFQGKMALDNIRDLILMPASLGAAAIDVVFRGDRDGRLFYRVLNWGRRSEELINVYGAVCDPDERREDADEDALKRDWSVDALVARLEAVIVREYEKGGTAASMKAAVDAAIDRLQAEADAQGGRARGALDRAMARFRGGPADGDGSQQSGLRARRGGRI